MSNYTLQVQKVGVRYGGIQAVNEIEFTLEEGQWGTLIGANGAGKSSIVRTITGLKDFSGDIFWRGRSIKGRNPEVLMRDGIVLVPEGRGIFTRMTVLENLQMGAWLRKDTTGVNLQIAQIFERFPRLGERKSQLAGLLSGGEQQLLALNRALLSQPRLLILDEPSMGLAPIMIEAIFELITSLKGSDINLLLIEQNARLALQLTDLAWVIDSGSIAYQGSSKDLLSSEIIQQIYLGETPV